MRKKWASKFLLNRLTWFSFGLWLCRSKESSRNDSSNKLWHCEQDLIRVCLNLENKTLKTLSMALNFKPQTDVNFRIQWDTDLFCCVNHWGEFPALSRYLGCSRPGLGHQASKILMCVCVSDEMKWVWFSPDADTETGCEPRWTDPAGSSWALSSGFYNSKAERSEAQFWTGSSRVRLHSQTTWAQSGREQSNHRETSCVQGQKHSTVEPREMENMLLAPPLKILYIKSFFFLHFFHGCFKVGIVFLFWFSYLENQQTLDSFSPPKHGVCWKSVFLDLQLLNQTSLWAVFLVVLI